MNWRRLMLLTIVFGLGVGPGCSRKAPDQTAELPAAAQQMAQPLSSGAKTTQPAESPTPDSDEPQQKDVTAEAEPADEVPQSTDPSTEAPHGDDVNPIEPGTALPQTPPVGGEPRQSENPDAIEKQTQEPAESSKNVWLDKENKRVVLKAKVVLREGFLEMLACLKDTKEHEAILAVDTKAALVHTQLLLAGAKPGKPVQFVPEYAAATGQKIAIQLEWKDEEGKLHHARAQEWIRNSETGKELAHPWVFAGSQFAPDGYYLAEDGDLICVANFPSAMLDLPVASTESNAELLFSAFTERIPPLGTEVTVYLKPAEKEDEKEEPQQEP